MLTVLYSLHPRPCSPPSLSSPLQLLCVTVGPAGSHKTANDAAFARITGVNELRHHIGQNRKEKNRIKQNRTEQNFKIIYFFPEHTLRITVYDSITIMLTTDGMYIQYLLYIHIYSI